MPANDDQLEAARNAYAATRIRLLDPDRVRARRISQGISEHALATATGLEPGVIRRIERGHSQNEMTVKVIATIADVLGCPITDLLADDYRPDPTALAADRDDPATLGTIAATAAGEPVNIDRVAELLGWTLPRALAALERLRAALAAAGQTISWAGPAQFRVTAPADPTGVAATIANDTSADDGLNAQTLRQLADIAAGKFNIKATKDARNRNLAAGWLTKAGFITTDADGPWHEASAVRLTDRARYDLCLDE